MMNDDDDDKYIRLLYTFLEEVESVFMTSILPYTTLDKDFSVCMQFVIYNINTYENKPSQGIKP